jgi:hypothetical protein
MNFTENWIFESFYSKNQRALLLYVQEFNGTIIINNTRINNHTGMYTKEVRDRLITNYLVS